MASNDVDPVHFLISSQDMKHTTSGIKNVHTGNYFYNYIPSVTIIATKSTCIWSVWHPPLCLVCLQFVRIGAKRSRKSTPHRAPGSVNGEAAIHALSFFVGRHTCVWFLDTHGGCDSFAALAARSTQTGRSQDSELQQVPETELFVFQWGIRDLEVNFIVFIVCCCLKFCRFLNCC